MSDVAHTVKFYINELYGPLDHYESKTLCVRMLRIVGDRWTESYRYDQLSKFIYYIVRETWQEDRDH